MFFLNPFSASCVLFTLNLSSGSHQQGRSYRTRPATVTLSSTWCRIATTETGWPGCSSPIRWRSSSEPTHSPASSPGPELRPCTRVSNRGGRNNRYSIALRYFAWQYCIDTQTPSIDILLYKLFILQIQISLAKLPSNTEQAKKITQSSPTSCAKTSVRTVLWKSKAFVTC